MIFFIKKLFSLILKWLLKGIKGDLLGKLLSFITRELSKALAKGQFVKFGLALVFILLAFLVLFIL